MHIAFDIPDSLERELQAENGVSLSQTAKEAFAIELYRQGKISLGELAVMVGIVRVEALEWLGRRNISMNYGLEDLEADRKTVKDVLGEKVA